MILNYLALVIAFSKISCGLPLLAGLFESTNDLLLLIVRIRDAALILCFNDVCRPFGRALLLRRLLFPAIVRMVYLSIAVLLAIFVIRIVLLTF